MSYYKTFRAADHNATDDFGAMRAAQDWMRARGFSYGSTCRGYPVGIMFGDYAIAKWRNLDRDEVKALHGVMRGNRQGEFRNADVTIELMERDAPADAIAAFREPVDSRSAKG